MKPAWATAALALAPAVFFSAELGQTSLIVGAAMIGGWVCRDERPALAGVLFGVAACIKPQAMILAPIVLWGRWRMLGWMAGAGAALVARQPRLRLAPLAGVAAGAGRLQARSPRAPTASTPRR